MTTPRYRIFDLAMRRYVRRVEVIDENPPYPSSPTHPTPPRPSASPA